MIRASYWFVPTVIMTSIAALSAFTLFLDHFYQGALPSWFILNEGDPQGARIFLSTVAGSMIGVAGVTFSITIVSLSLASSQFGPRILKSFMRSKANQFVLGIFIATFLYCLVILQFVKGSTSGLFVPSISTNVALFLTLLCLKSLIYFIHHVANSIQIDTIVTNVVSELRLATDRFCSKEYKIQEKENGTQTTVDWENIKAIKSPKSGYLQAVDYDELLRIAANKNLIVNVLNRAGDFLQEGSPIIKIYQQNQEDELEREVLKFILIGLMRTEQQDLEYSIRQLVEIATRALSPGINDSFTAITCIDWLGAAINRIAIKGMPPRYLYDDQNKLRIITNETTFEGVCATAFNQIRQAAAKDISVSLRLLEVLANIGNHVQKEVIAQNLLEHAKRVRFGIAPSLLDGPDGEAIKERYEAVEMAVKKVAP